MKYYTIKPPEALTPYIKCFWVLEHELDSGEQSYVYRSIADGCVEMVFHYRGAFNELVTNGEPANWLSGFHFQCSNYRRFQTDESFGIFGAYIYPFAIPYLFNVPSENTTNQMLSLDTFIGNCGKELEDRIVCASDNFMRAKILSDFFYGRLQKSDFKDDAIAAAIMQVIRLPHAATVDQLASQFNMSAKQFGRKFKAYSGFNPKMYMRLNRLGSALKQPDNGRSLGRIAYDCRYYDQSHFIHEVKEFTGYHPAFYFSGKAEGTEYKYV